MRLKREVRVGLIGSVAVITGLAGMLTFATAAGAKKTTTTTTASTTTTTTSATTTTTVPCNAQPASASADGATMTVTPGTCVNGGTVVTVTGSGFDPSASGLILQCNGASGEPTITISVVGNSETLPVSCTPLVITHVITTDASGNIPPGKTWSVIAGTTGPPCGAGSLAPTCPADSSGGNAVADAANYPCPPTPAQVAAGATCNISFGDAGGKAVTVPITFVPTGVTNTTTTTAPATSPSTGGSGTTATTAAPTTAASTATKSSSLAFTGPGAGLYIVGIAGLIMLLVGGAIVGLSGAPTSLALAMRRKRRDGNG